MYDTDCGFLRLVLFRHNHDDEEAADDLPSFATISAD